MKIVYLDQPTYLPESFVSEMNKLGEFTVYHDRPDENEVIRRLADAEIAIVEWTPLRGKLFRSLPKLKHIIVVMTAYDLIDLEEAGQAGITVSNCPEYSARSVAEHVFALLLAVNRKLLQADRTVRQGGRHVYPPFLAMELAGKTLGLIGTGKIGRAVAGIAHGFGMNVIGTNRSGRAAPGIAWREMSELMRQSDVVSLHVPFQPENEGMISSRLLSLMKRTAVFINTSRAGLVDEEALYQMLRERKIAGAGLDDAAKPPDHPLYKLDNVVFTPGTAWYTDTSREANMTEILENVKACIQGFPRNVVNAEYVNRSLQ
jgi:glycerate dehydrogenase